MRKSTFIFSAYTIKSRFSIFISKYLTKKVVHLSKCTTKIIFLFHDPVDSYFLTHTFQNATDRHIKTNAMSIIDMLMNHGFIVSNIKLSTGMDIINPNGKINRSNARIADG